MFLEAEAFATFKSLFLNVVEAIAQIMRFGTLSARDFALFITNHPLTLALFLMFAIGLGIGLVRRLKSL